MILNLFRFKKNMSSRTKINWTVFFRAISITRFCAFSGIFANFRKIANYYFSKFLSKYWSDGKLKYGLSYSKFNEDFKNSNGNINKRHLDVIMTSSNWHFCHILVNFYKKNHIKINSLVECWYDLYIVYKRFIIAFSHYLGQKEQIWGGLPSCIL